MSDKTPTQPKLDGTVCISTTEMHTCGDPVRIVESGFPEMKGNTFDEKRLYAENNLQQFRKMLTNEPRGHRDMVGFILVEPDADTGAAVGVIFFDSSVFLDMCGHMTIALARYAVDRGLVPVTSPLTSFKIQAACGLLTANIEVSPDGRSGSSGFLGVPAFVYKTGVKVDVKKLGTVTVDISFGGAFYAILPAADIGLDVNTSPIADLTSAAAAISDALRSSFKVQHPVLPTLTYLQGTILTDGNDKFSEQPARTFVTLCENAQVPRAPCGSGTTACVALQFYKHEIELNQTRVFENAMTHTRFYATPKNETSCGEFSAVEVEIQGRAHYTGSATYTFEEGDPVGEGFVPGTGRK